MRYERSKHVPPTPDELRNLTIQGEWANTKGDNPEQFVIYDNGPDTDARIVIFASPPCLRKLCTANIWFMDGNFAMAPRPGFLQMYIIRVPLGSTAVTTVYALLQRKSQEIYEEMLRAISDYCGTQNLFPAPATVLCDFEIALIRAVQDVFGDITNIQGCFYHFTQSTWRKIQEEGLTQEYKGNEDFKLLCAKLDGLAFLPNAKVQEAFESLRGTAPDIANPIVDYISNTYVNGTYGRANVQLANGDVGIRMRRMPPRFPIELWNVHDATLSDGPRTNNMCEGFNNRFLQIVGCKHPGI